ncbi:MAG: polysaccharide deacetylase family protein [Candidatus Cloacimonetes bacterium]|nr:polysaccharide deacetylase family protein [Candidatus Cloacimonadota bacterium]
MKKKYFVIFILLLMLVATIYMMMKVENKIREEKIIVIDSTKVRIDLLPEYNSQSLLRAYNKSKINFRIAGDYFEILSIDRKSKNQEVWNPIFLKGVNLGAALPGKFPSEFPYDFNLYMDWFEKIGKMNSNVVRIYTIFPPVFYEAFAQYNLLYSDNPLYLMQGVWATVPQDHNYFDEDYTYYFQKEIKDVIDVIHGNAVLAKSRGKAEGVYISDISDYTIAYLLGREWEPKGVTFTNQNSSVSSYDGNFISIPNGTPMEVWLAQIMDYSLKYETLKYENQHPVSFVNWLPLDPMYHNSEHIENDKVREYDNDLEIVDFRKFYKTDLVKTGIYAAYHAYPYYPDYVYLDKKYQKGDNNYLPYLQDLKIHCPDMPLIIAEYGVPSSRGNSHYTPYGFDQGGHNEKEQARINKLLTENIHQSNCGGAIMFEWIDEWFKFNWMVMDFEQPQHRRKYWHNKENPEQNFGIMAIENNKIILDGRDDDWSEPSLFKDEDIQADADPSYFYLKYHLEKFNFEKNNLYIAIDTYDKKKGDHTIPIINKKSANGIEFFLKFNSADSAQILVDDEYSVFSDIYNDYIPAYSSKDNNDGRFVPQELISNRERETLLGEKYKQLLHNRSKLVFGKIEENSNADWFYDTATGILEIRLPWHLLNVSDPSSLQVLDDIEGTPDIETSTIDKLNIYSFITNETNQVIYTIPKNDKPFPYIWKGWEEPKYETRLKEQYFVLQDLFAKMEPLIPVKSQKITKDFKITKWYKNSPGAISITFDDGSYGQYEFGFPILKKYHINADFGILGEWTTEKPQTTSEEGVFGIERMGWEEIRKINFAGNEISSHGYKHEKIDASKSAKELIAELLKNKLLIQDNIDDSVYTIHYPYSFARDNIIEATQKSGFLFGRVGDGNITNGIDNLLRINSKVILNNNDPNPKQFYDWIVNAENEWLVLMYHHIFKENSKAMDLFDYHKVYNRYAVTPKIFDNQVRLLRNSGYWIGTTSQVGKYITERENAELKFKAGYNSFTLELQSDLDMSIYTQPLTIEFTTDWEVIKITNSEDDGIYNPRNGKLYFSTKLNKKVIIEKIR